MSSTPRTIAKFHLVSLITSGIFFATFLVVPAEPESSSWPMESTTQAYQLSQTGQHPSLGMTAVDFERVRTSLAGDVVARGLNERVLAKANGILSQPVAAYDPSVPSRLYEVSQVISDRVTTLGTAWQMSRNSVYAERLWSELLNTASFTNWTSGHFLDTAALSQAVAVGYDWLYEYWTPSRRQILETAIIDKGLTPGAAQFTQSAHWTKEPGNWNIVINSGLGMAALAIRDVRPALANSILDASLISVRYGLQGFDPDGGFREGLQYWSYAIHNVVQYGLSLRMSLGDDRGIFGHGGIKASGLFPLYMTGPSGQAFHYSDSKALDLTPALHQLGSDYSNPVYAKLAYDNALQGNINQFALLWYKPGSSRQTPVQAGLSLDRYFRHAEVVSMRSGWGNGEAVFAALKAGTGSGNGHPHLDAGSFVLDALGVNWATELGPDSYLLPGYSEGTSAGARWNYYRTRAEGSNTVVLRSNAAPDQKPGSSSVIERFETSSAKAYSIADLTSANDLEVSSWRRGLMLFDNRQQVMLRDEIQGNKSVDAWWFMHTDASIQIAGDGRSAILVKDGKQMLVRLVGSTAQRFSSLPASPLPTSPNPNGQAANQGVGRLAVRLSGMISTTVAVQFTPLRSGLPTPVLEAEANLASWSIREPASEVTGITVAGRPLSNFLPQALTYDVTSAPGMAVPQIAAAGALGAQVSVVQAPAVPGVAKISVTQPGKEKTVYAVFIGKGAHPVSSVKASLGWATAPNTIDGDPLTKWIAGGNQSLTYDLGSVKSVAATSISWASTGPSPSRYTVKTSENGIDWITHGNWSVPPSIASVVTDFPAVRARFVQVVIDSQNISNRYTGIYEFRVLADRPAKPPLMSAADPASVSLSQIPGTIDVSYRGQMKTDVRNSAGISLTAAGLSTRFVSSDPGVLTVDASGYFAAVGPGTARLGAYVTASSGRVVYASAIVVVTNPWKTTIAAVADTYVHGSAANADVNFGTSPGLLVKQTPWPEANREAYMAFDLSAYRGKKIVSASLYFWGHTSDSSGTLSNVAAREILGTWSEFGVTYRTKPALGQMLGSVSLDERLALRKIDVTAYIQRASQAGLSANLALSQDVPSASAGLLSFVYGRESTRKPVLEIITANT